MKNMDERKVLKTILVDIEKQRLDKFLVESLDVPRKVIQSLIKDGYILINQNTVKPSFNLKLGDKIDIYKLESESKNDYPPREFDLDILFEDDDLLVVYKPVGVLVYPFKENQVERTLVDALKEHTDQLADEAGSERPGIVHRLDRNTEGVLLVAKSNQVYNALKQQFKDRKVEKRYYARVKGELEQDAFLIDKSIGRQKSSIKQDINPNSKDLKEAQTQVTVIKRYQSATLVDIRLITGRTHQIRVHFSAMGHPVLGDVVYGQASFDSQQKLQAYYLGFEHPRTQKWVSVERKISPRLLSDKETKDVTFVDSLYNKDRFRIEG